MTNERTNIAYMHPLFWLVLLLGLPIWAAIAIIAVLFAVVRSIIEGVQSGNRS